MYLEDTVENTYTLLTNEGFELTAQTALSGMGRFFIHFTSSTLSADTVRSTSLLTAYKGKGNTYISVEGLQQFSEPAKLTLYNALGMKVLSSKDPKPFTERDAIYAWFEDRSLHPKSTGRKYCFYKKISHLISIPHEKNRKHT